MSNKQKLCQAGYTIVELMVALALTGIVSVGIYKSYISVATTYDVQDQVVEVQQNSRVGMGRMVREIRMAGYDPTKIGFAGIDPASTSTRIIINRYDDVSAVTQVTYEWDGTDGADLKRSSLSVIENISALEFIYVSRDVNGNLVEVTPANAQGVKIALVVRSTNEDYAYTNNDVYDITLPDGSPLTVFTAPGDNYRRRLLVATVLCRNLRF